MRGADPAGLMRYLFSPGRHNEHTDPHVVAHWSGLPADVAPPTAEDGTHDLTGLIADLKTDLAAAGLLGADATVWHCSVSLPAQDGPLSDARWRAVAEAIVAEVGLDDRQAGAVRWVAVRHGLSRNGNDHIHLVAALAGRTADGTVVDRRFLRRDFAAVRRVCTRAETRWKLTRTGAGTGAAHRHPQRAEREIAARRGMTVPQRHRLERAVRSAAVASRGPAEFTARLAIEGIEAVFTRPSTRQTGTWLGVTFRTPDYTDKTGQPIEFSGRALAKDLTAPALHARWNARTADGAGPTHGTTGQLIAALADQLRAATIAGAPTTPEAAPTAAPTLHRLARAGADGLWAAAEACEADRGGPWHTAASEAARAAREPGPVDDPDDDTLSTGIRAVTAGLATRPHAQSKADAELARAHAMFTRLLRLWAHTSHGEPARVAAAAAAQITTLAPSPPAAPARLSVPVGSATEVQVDQKRSTP